jgi:hypothetical protein
VSRVYRACAVEVCIAVWVARAGVVRGVAQRDLNAAACQVVASCNSGSPVAAGTLTPVRANEIGGVRV